MLKTRGLGNNKTAVLRCTWCGMVQEQEHCHVEDKSHQNSSSAPCFSQFERTERGYWPNFENQQATIPPTPLFARNMRTHKDSEHHRTDCTVPAAIHGAAGFETSQQTEDPAAPSLKNVSTDHEEEMTGGQWIPLSSISQPFRAIGLDGRALRIKV